MDTRHLPFLISIPHGGTLTPPQIAERVQLAPIDLFQDSDAYTCEIYDVSAFTTVVTTDIARAFVDVSRPLDALPPKFPDGVIKSHTCMNKPIYKIDQQPDDTLIQELFKNYYHPYHEKLRKASIKPFTLGLDCHSMLAFSPLIDQNPGQPRPLINLGNLDGTACPQSWIELLAASFHACFNMPENEITINSPFKGGYITQCWANNPIPWIQIEINRKLYLSEPWFDESTLQIDSHRLEELNQLFCETLFHFKKLLIDIL